MVTKATIGRSWYSDRLLWSRPNEEEDLIQQGLLCHISWNIYQHSGRGGGAHGPLTPAEQSMAERQD